MRYMHTYRERGVPKVAPITILHQDLRRKGSSITTKPVNEALRHVYMVMELTTDLTKNVKR